jgi:hypothetical protein
MLSVFPRFDIDRPCEKSENPKHGASFGADRSNEPLFPPSCHLNLPARDILPMVQTIPLFCYDGTMRFLFRSMCLLSGAKSSGTLTVMVSKDRRQGLLFFGEFLERTHVNRGCE